MFAAFPSKVSEQGQQVRKQEHLAPRAKYKLFEVFCFFLILFGVLNFLVLLLVGKPENTEVWAALSFVLVLFSTFLATFLYSRR